MSDTTNIYDVTLLDGSHISIPIQHKLLTRELRDIVASHANLREKQFFGLAYIDENVWYYLQLDRKVSDHDIPKKCGQYRLYFLVEFYLESIHYLNDCNTYEQFYLQAKQSLTKGDLECDADTFFRLLGLTMQIIYSDFVDVQSAKSNLKKLDAIPTRIFELHPSIEYCEKQTFHYYKQQSGLEKGDAILEFLDILERIPSYGIHFYEVKDKQDVPWWLGLSYKGISQYDYRDKTIPRKSFIWSQINEFSSSKQRFTMEILDSKKASMTRRGLPSVSMHWYTSGVQKAKMISSLAGDHLNFFSSIIQNSVVALAEKFIEIDSFMAPIMRKKNKERKRSDVAYELTNRRHSFSRLPNRSNKMRPRAESLMRPPKSDCECPPANEEQLGACMEESTTARTDFDDSTLVTSSFHQIDSESALSTHQLKQSLLQKKAELIKALKEKEAEMRQLMTQEFELTGVMPDGYNEILTMSSIARPHKKTSFVLSPHLVKKTGQTASGCSHSGSLHSHHSLDEQLNQLEIEYAVVKNIYEANKQKAKETRKKAYRIAYKSNAAKLKKLEEEIKAVKCGCSLSTRSSKLDIQSLNFDDDKSSGSFKEQRSGNRDTITSLSDASSMQSSSAVSSCSGIIHSYSQGSLPDLARTKNSSYHCSSQISLPGGNNFSQSTRWQPSPQRENLPVSGDSLPSSQTPQPGNPSTVTSTQSSPPHRALPGSGDSGFISLHHTDGSSICGSSTLTREDSSSSSCRRPAADVCQEEDEAATIHRHQHCSCHHRRGSNQVKRLVEASTQRLSLSDSQLDQYWYEPKDLVPAHPTAPDSNDRRAVFTNSVNRSTDRRRVCAPKSTERTKPGNQTRSASQTRSATKQHDLPPPTGDSRSVLARETEV